MALPQILTAALLAAPVPVLSASTFGDVIPAPVSAVPSGADFHLDRNTVIQTRTPAVGTLLASDLAAATGLTLPVTTSAAPAARKISLRIAGGLGDGYQLTVNRSGVEVTGGNPEALFNGTQTLLQLREGRAIAGGTVQDRPRFAYRGSHLDLARHFHTPDEVKKYIDEIRRLKINYLHLHLSDDQGWRIQIDGWPRLTEIGGAAGTGVDGVGGGFLTKAQYADLVAYAAARFVTIVPEIDMPGHVNAAQVAYPELTCDGVAPPPRTDTAVGYSSLCISSETTYRFVEDVIRELAAITPGPYIHIGGDEAHATPPADYLTFQNRVIPLVAKYGKTAYGWNEIAQSPAAHSSVAQYWGTTRSNPVLAGAVANGTRVVMSPANKAYLDMKYDRNTRLGLTWAGLIEVRTAYDWDPGTHLTGVPESAVLGVEAALWSETLRSIDDIEFMAFPRLAAIAELAWSPASTHDWESFRSRLAAHGPQWTARGVDFYPSPQISWE
ncbi:beta-N-acetylhexosaminidase [Actinoplanes sp. NPDC051470]|uniref:beta-N-acetylhexosaminidase n=1 Tax=unclassified Actinoplanes TaxID=2626549 RepID=UPI0034487BF9